MILEYMLFTIAIIAMIVNVYSVKRKYLPGILVSAFFMIAQLLVYVNMSGVSEFKQNIVRSSQQVWIVAMVYAAFIWGIGYVLGAINTKKKENLGELSGEDKKYME